MNVFLRNYLRSQRFYSADGAIAGSTGDQAATDENGSDQAQTKEPKTLSADEVNSVVQKRLAQEKAKWEKDYESKLSAAKTEAEKLAAMNAEQKAKYEQDKTLAALSEREKAIVARELKAEAYETLAGKGIPKELADVLNYGSAETCKASLDAVEKAFQKAVEQAVNDKLRGGNPPKTGGSQEYASDLSAAMKNKKFNLTEYLKQKETNKNAK